MLYLHHNNLKQHWQWQWFVSSNSNTNTSGSVSSIRSMKVYLIVVQFHSVYPLQREYICPSFELSLKTKPIIEPRKTLNKKQKVRFARVLSYNWIEWANGIPLAFSFVTLLLWAKVGFVPSVYRPFVKFHKYAGPYIGIDPLLVQVDIWLPKQSEYTTATKYCKHMVLLIFHQFNGRGVLHSCHISIFGLYPSKLDIHRAIQTLIIRHH